MTLGSLLVVGDVVTDVIARHGRPAVPRTDTAAAISVRPGGSAANTAAWAAHLGAATTLLARVGSDTGEWHRARLRDAGVRPHLIVDAGRPTAVIIVMVDGNGERTMLTDRGAGARLCPADWAESLLDDVAHLHISGYTLFTDTGRSLAGIAVAAAARRSVTVSVDPASAGFLADFGPRRFIEATAGASLIVPNGDEAALLTGTADPAVAAARLSADYGLAVVKLGAAGAVTARRGSVAFRTPGVPAEAVDSTGAGDAFAGGLLAARLAGASDAGAVAAGCRAGARAVARLGGRP